VKQCPIFRFGPLSSTAVDEPHIEKLVRVRFVWRFRYPLEEEQAAVETHPAPAVYQDRQRGVVVPIVDDAAEEVRVTVSGHCFEEVACDDLAASRNIRST
jgi:hypothetical protein